MADNKNKVYLSSLLFLRCPHCNKTPLLKNGSWFDFKKGCDICGYDYEREEGYFWGAPFMLNYPITGAIGITSFVFLEPHLRTYDVYFLAAIVSFIFCACALLLFPFAKALWMFLDHLIHPIFPKK